MNTTIPLEFRDLWRANTDDDTIYVAAATRAEAHDAMRRIIQAMMYKPNDDTTLDESYCNLSSASEMIEEGVSDNLTHRLLESGWFGGKPLYVDAPIMVLPNSKRQRLMQAWFETRQADREARKHMADYQPGRATLRASAAK